LVWFYIQKLVAPFGLSEMYFGAENVSFLSIQFLVSLFAVVIVSVGLIYWGRKSNLAAFSALLLGLSLVPPLLGVTVFPRHELVHNRYAYFPSVGVCILFALGLEKLFHRQGVTDSQLKQRWLATSIAAGVAVVLSVSVWKQEQPYHDNLALFSKAVQLSPESAAAWGLLGEEQMTLGHYAEGIGAFQHAQALEPAALLSNYRLGAAYYFVHDMAAAEKFFRRAVDSYHDGDAVTYDYALYRLGLTQYAQDKMPEAEGTLRRAIQIQPKAFGYHVALGAALKHEGKLIEAKEEFEMELALGPDVEATALLREVEERLGEGRSVNN
jgi:tetratricopeptide (TPR) repeat protein